MDELLKLLKTISEGVLVGLIVVLITARAARLKLPRWSYYTSKLTVVIHLRRKKETINESREDGSMCAALTRRASGPPVRYKLEMSKTTAESLKAMASKTEMTRKGILDHALTLYEWALRERLAEGESTSRRPAQLIRVVPEWHSQP